MKEYTVKWEMQLYASSPQEAAEEAREIQLDIYSEATFFDVEDSSGVITGVEL
jgi:hypothetical protein